MKKRNKIMIAVFLVILVAFIATAVIRTNLEKNLEKLAGITLVNVDLAMIEDGVYTGSYSSFPVAADVKVTVKNHRITGIDLVKHSNGQGAAAEVLPQKVVEAQSLSVDTVSGATYSSKVILKAIEAALTGAIK